MKELLHTEAADGILKLHYKDYLHYCRVTTATPGRGVVTEHMIIYVNSGELELTTQGRTYHLRKGDAYMLRRNHLCQKQARPLPGNEPFEGIFFYLTVPMLRRAMSQNGISLRGAKPWTRSSAYIALPRSPLPRKPVCLAVGLLQGRTVSGRAAHGTENAGNGADAHRNRPLAAFAAVRLRHPR